MSKKPELAHEGYKVGRDYIAMTVPLLIMAFFFYGPRVLVLALVAYITAFICDRFSCMLKNKKYDKTENSSKYFAILIVLLMPANVPFYVVVSAVIVAVLVAKEAFGGYRSYPFNPAAVGACVAAVSWPEKVLKYPMPTMWVLNSNLTWEQRWKIWTFEDANVYDGLYSTLNKGNIPNISDLDLLLGNFAGALGIASVLILASCAIYLVVRKSMDLTAPLTFLATCAVISFFFPRIINTGYSREFIQLMQYGLESLKYEMLTGMIPFAAIFLVTEPGTLPKNKKSRIIYGVLLGFATMMFNYFGKFEFGACFALILVNAISGYFDRLFAKVDTGKKSPRRKIKESKVKSLKGETVSK